jgi:serine/threonine protein kinase
MLQIGQTISAYQLLAHIASGGQATVYRARHTVLQREVALKVLHPHLLTAPDFVEKFAREAQLLAQLKHPNIVEVYDANRDAATGLYFIAIEFLPGTDLETLIAQQGKLAVEVVVAVAQQVASALEYAHARNLIHRDIKPSNLMLLPDGTVKVLDFGIAAIIAAGQKAQTRIGTVEYMAPEHFAGNADARSDIYSLGATLYHCLTGQLPPVIAVQPPTPPRQLNPAISPRAGERDSESAASRPCQATANGARIHHRDRERAARAAGGGERACGDGVSTLRRGESCGSAALCDVWQEHSHRRCGVRSCKEARAFYVASTSA